MEKTTISNASRSRVATQIQRPFDLWEGINPFEASKLRSRLVPLRVTAGQTFIRQGDTDACLYLIDRGAVEVRLNGRTLANVNAGHVVGEMALLNKEPRNADVIAVTDCELSRLAAADFVSLCRQMPQLKLVLTRLVAHRLNWSGADVLARRIGSFNVVEHLGSGSMGWVFRATHRKETYALKMLPHELVQQPRFLDRYRREAGLLRRLRHKNIVGLHAVIEQYGTIFLALEYVPGATVQEWIDQHHLPNLTDTQCVIQSVARALLAAHQRGIVHRDVKPANVMISDTGVVKLVDFGIASSLRRTVKVAETSLTPAYAAPEQFHQAQVGPEADFFSLGIMTYQLLTGHLPFPDVWSRETTVRPVTEWGRRIPDDLKRFTDAALTKEPRARQEAVQTFLQNWQGLNDDRTVSNPPQRPPPCPISTDPPGVVRGGDTRLQTRRQTLAR